MLASPIEDGRGGRAELPDFAVEDKFDGIRAHAHKSGSRVTLFSRTLDEVTAQFPEIALALGRAAGTVSPRRGDRGLAGRPAPTPSSVCSAGWAARRRQPELLAEIPVAFVAYDCLASGETPAFEARGGSGAPSSSGSGGRAAGSSSPEVFRASTRRGSRRSSSRRASAATRGSC